MEQYDFIVVGGGHNGLVCATMLSRAGRKVLVLEADDAVGGLAREREFFPGFKTSVAHSLNHFSQRVADELCLSDHGYQVTKTTLDTIGLSLDAEPVRIGDSTLSGADEADASSYREYRALLKRFADALAPFWTKTIPGVGENSAGELLTFAQLGLKLRLLGKKDMLEFLRVATLPMRDLMDDNFDHKLVQSALAWDGIIGSKLAPRSPNQSVFTLLYRMCGVHQGMHYLPAGGIAGLVSSLRLAAESAGVTVRCNAPVARIEVDGSEDGLKAVGVELANGERIAASNIVSAVDPQRTFLGLIGPQYLEIEFTNRIRRLRCEGYVAKLHLALSDLPEFPGLARPDGRMIIAPEMDAIEFAFDDAKYGAWSADPVMEVLIPTLQEPGLAPAGQHVLSAHVMYVPAELKGGWTDSAREALRERLFDELEKYAPGLRQLVLHAELLTPKDLESEYGVTGGHWHHTEFAVDQLLMMRPTYDAAQYAAPIPGLYLCGAGNHPGGGLTGAPGYNAAREILK